MKGRNRSFIAVWAGLALVAGASPAWAHGDIEEASPGADTTVRKPPRNVRVDLAEPPAEGSTLVVTDGCNERVSGDASIDEDILAVPISDGRPGRWRVKLRSISAVDGHLVKDSFSFRVRGQKDCSAEESPTEAEDDEPAEDDEVELGDPQPPIQNTETSFPFVPFALGTVVLVGVAIALRRPGRRP